MADAVPPDPAGWQKVAVDPRVVSARVAGISHGFLVFDDTGSEWKRDGEKFDYLLFPNRFFFSRDAGKDKAPYFTVVLGEKDSRPPAVPTRLVQVNRSAPPAEAWLSWVTPRDQGTAGVIGFDVLVDNQPIPRYLIPAAKNPGKTVLMHLRDLDLKGRTSLRISTPTCTPPRAS